MIRKRFLPLRGLKIVTWTVAAVAWVTAAIAGRALATTATSTAAAPAESTTTTPAETQAAVPALPDNGLIVIRAGSTASQAQQQQVVRKVVVQAPARQTATAAPVRQRSSGS
jgi:hypothetical protein